MLSSNATGMQITKGKKHLLECTENQNENGDDKDVLGFNLWGENSYVHN